MYSSPGTVCPEICMALPCVWADKIPHHVPWQWIPMLDLSPLCMCWHGALRFRRNHTPGPAGCLHTLRQSPIPGPLCWRFNVYLLYILAALLHTPLGLRGWWGGSCQHWSLSTLIAGKATCTHALQAESRPLQLLWRTDLAAGKGAPQGESLPMWTFSAS